MCNAGLFFLKQDADIVSLSVQYAVDAYDFPVQMVECNIVAAHQKAEGALYIRDRGKRPHFGKIVELVHRVHNTINSIRGTFRVLQFIGNICPYLV